jgi:hypothetical protein
MSIPTETEYQAMREAAKTMVMSLTAMMGKDGDEWTAALEAATEEVQVCKAARKAIDEAKL